MTIEYTKGHRSKLEAFLATHDLPSGLGDEESACTLASINLAMTNEEQVQQALRELWDIVKCRCNEAYTGRGMHDPDCECDSTDALQIVTEAIQILTEQLAAARQDAKEADAYAEELEQQLAKAAEGLHAVVKHDASTFFGPDGEKNKRASWRGVMRKVRAAMIPKEGGEWES